MLKMPRTAALALIAAAFLLAALPARAEIALQPGLWQETETGSENNQPAKTETSTRCMTAEEAKQPSKAVVFDETLRQHCKALDYKRSGDEISLRMQCGTQGFAVDVNARFTLHSPQHYSGTLHAALDLGPMKLTADKMIDARRLGDCPK
jgi:Protein of unknown function (DUF3617)